MKTKILIANRGEIAVRIIRTASELGLWTVAIYSYEDRHSTHCQKANEAYQIGHEGEFGPVEAYLQIDRIVSIARRSGAQLVHPGYGFLSENANFANAVRSSGIEFIGPSVEVLKIFGDKVAGRQAAIQCQIPVVPGTKITADDASEAHCFAKKHKYPVLIKSAFGGGGRGIRVVHDSSSLNHAVTAASSEALNAFGDGTVFVEKYLTHPKHIEVQIIADSHYNAIHLFERDCSLQRRFQKIVEIAPAPNLSSDLRRKILDAAVRLARSVKYVNAGTVEFIVQGEDFYFIEMNPRIQVEHTITEEVTGIDLIAMQIAIAQGRTLSDLRIRQENITIRGFSIQCRVTTEIAEEGFRPDSGKVEACQLPYGPGVRLDSASLYVGADITPFYDSLLVKCICTGSDFENARTRSIRALKELHLGGINTNTSFLLKLLENEKFIRGQCWTTFIEQSMDTLLSNDQIESDETSKIALFLSEAAVNGTSIMGLTCPPALMEDVKPPAPLSDFSASNAVDWRKILLAKGPAAFAKSVAAHKSTLITDTTWRDGQQSLLATRVRTRDLEAIATYTSHAYAGAYSLECWGGATFDVTMRFLHEDPWDRLRKLRQLIPNIPFQMLLRSTNGVAYSALPANAIAHFVQTAKDNGMDIFRVFDGLNDVQNLSIGIKAALATGAVVEGAILYTGDMLQPGSRYTLQYYMDLADKLVAMGSHVIALKSMSGVLKPSAGAMFVRAFKAKYPHLPLHMHSHDNNGTAVATMMACAAAGADIVDTAIDSLSGTTSQPAISSVLGALEATGHDAELDLNKIKVVDEYWAQLRLVYAGFDAGLRSPDPDSYRHEIPGGQYSNLLFQARSLGLGSQWAETRQAYVDANLILGDIIKATPTSKAVGDLAQFMVDRKLDMQTVQKRASQLDFPLSIIEFCQGLMGQPFGGFPEPFRSDVLKRSKRTSIKGNPADVLPPVDFASLRDTLSKLLNRSAASFTECDLASYIQYPAVYLDFQRHRARYGDLSVLPTYLFLTAPELGTEYTLSFREGHHITYKLVAIGNVDPDTARRNVYMEVNSEVNFCQVLDRSAIATNNRPKANQLTPNEVGATMKATVTRVMVSKGDKIEHGQLLLTLTAMKMEVSVSSPVSGLVDEVLVKEKDEVEKDDLLVCIEDEA